MTEGWLNDDYFILFAEDEIERLTREYDVQRYLPGYELLGVKLWDDFIVRDRQGSTYTVPTVPLGPRYLEAVVVPSPADALSPDPLCEGKVKWWIQPIVFGGTSDASNSEWVSRAKHIELVRWWNNLYQEAKPAQ